MNAQERYIQRSVDAMSASPHLPSGFVEHQCRLAIQDMIKTHGARAAIWIVTRMLDDETERMKP